MRKIGWRVSAALCVAGVAAALAARQGRDVRRLDLSEVRAALMAMGAIVPPAAGEGLPQESWIVGTGPTVVMGLPAD